jgi:hypothetical protein
MHSIRYLKENGKSTRNRFDARSNGNNVFLSLGHRYDNFDFTKSNSINYESLLIERWQQLRKQYNHINLWFSGGKDSRLVLDTAIKNNIHIDEISVIRPTLFPDNMRILNLAEHDVNALQYLEFCQTNLSKTKINIIEFRDRHYATIYNNPTWFNNHSVWAIFVAWTTENIIKYFKDEFNIKTGNGAVDILGNIHPHVYFDQSNSWKFEYVDRQFQDLGSTVEIFNVTEKFPELTKAYVDLVRNYCINNNLFPERFANSINYYRDQVSPYNQINLVNSRFQFPKVWNNWTPEKTLPYQVNNGFKSMLNLLLCEQQFPQPQGFINYMNNTRWDLIEPEFEYGGICSKSFNF